MAAHFTAGCAPPSPVSVEGVRSPAPVARARRAGSPAALDRPNRDDARASTHLEPVHITDASRQGERVMDDRDVFLKAIDVLQERGWYQGEFRDIDNDGTALCILGACGVALNGDVYAVAAGDLPMEDETRLLDALGLIGYFGEDFIDPVALWNDDPSRTVEDVVLALKRAAHGEAA